ncbi:hypothetical protein GWK48_10860 [Metallosphaera tengchongensis]|uniref:Uncharacterized protein n=1 Tax=Metallosphaera tengchongensis TaxID=1532350 RepID=A0A6N0NX59_9CREN|nr:hypothetical protein [Metallosphaera tengchongensis]QKR00817.1 hypothetical protein GWK48_10860 [Metallosphaera tengchongensis]
MSSLLFQGFSCVDNINKPGNTYSTPTDKFPSLEGNFVNGSLALVLAPVPNNYLTLAHVGLVMAYGLEYNGNETYVNVIGTYNNEGNFGPTQGWSIYLFLTESSQYPYGNHSIPYWVTQVIPTTSNETSKNFQLGEFFLSGEYTITPTPFPYSTTPYIVVYFLPGFSGSVYLYIVNLTSPKTPPNVTKIGLGYGFEPKPGDAVLMSVTFSHNGALKVFTEDLTTGENKTFVYDLKFDPSPGEYWTAVGGNTSNNAVNG